MHTIEILALSLFLFFAVWLGYILGSKMSEEIAESKLKNIVPDLRKKAIRQSEAVIKGNISEQLAPFLPGFPFNPKDCRFIGKPIDLIVFDTENQEIVFVEVKTGSSGLTKKEKQLKKIIKNRNIRWYEYRL